MSDKVARNHEIGSKLQLGFNLYPSNSFLNTHINSLANNRMN